MRAGDSAATVYRQALPVILLSLVAGLFAGTVLGSAPKRAGIDRVPGVLLLVPAFLATRGGVYGSLGARWSSALHQGLVRPRFDPEDVRLGNAVATSFLNGMTVSVFIAILAFVILLTLGRPGSRVTLVGVMIVAGLLPAVVMLSVLVWILGWATGTATIRTI